MSQQVDSGTDEDSDARTDPSAESTLGADDPPKPEKVDDDPSKSPAGTGTAGDGQDFGTPGPPINRRSPFFIGFVGALGALLAYYLLQLIASISTILTLVGVAIFLAIGLDPAVRALQRRGLKRSWAVALVFLVVVLFFGGFIAAVVPTIIEQAGQLTQSFPDILNKLQDVGWIKRLDQQYDVISRASTELEKRISNGDTVMQLFGGVVGAGRAVVSGVGSAFTVLILTLYFLASLNTIAETFYRMVPRTRRPRFRALGDEMVRRVGGYVAGQVGVASINAVCSFIFLSIVHMPYALVLAILVGIFGLIPLVGATIGAAVVALVGFFQSWQLGLGVVVYYVVYQLLENYVISPRIMSRTVSVPGGVALVAALAGGALFGVLGALTAIPIAAAILLVLEQVVIPRQDRH